MAIPSVAIVGRPNVGKSSVFNWLAGRRIAIVDPTAGVTRDRVSTLLEIGERKIELFDTGGMGIEDADNLTSMVEKQIHYGMEQASLLLFVVDARDGVVPLDESISQKIHDLGKPVLLLVNKCDAPSLDVNSLDFFQLGFSKLVCVSAQQNRGKEDLLKLIAKNLPDLEEEGLVPDEVTLKLAIVGRRNTGKSTFINCLAKAERMIVSEVPGTTRDSVDVRFEQDGKIYLAIDTAGVRKRKSLASDIEFYSLHRAERSIRRADVVLLFFDASKPVSRVDKKLAEYILEQNKTAIFVMNKWDLLRPMPTGNMVTYVRSTFPSLDHVPIAFITAKSGKNVQAVLNLAQSLHKQASIRISTGELNRVVRDALARNEPPMRKNRRAKVFYATQAEAN
ncbi:MAG: ribosome biogenesis GTPase Der, partial [Gemmataceae bacterium]